MIRKHDFRVAMHGSRLSAVHSVQQQRPSGLFDFLSQPRRIRPLPVKSKECEMVETKPRRRIRVIHILSTKKAKTNTTAEAPPNRNQSWNAAPESYACYFDIRNSENQNSTWDNFQNSDTHVVQADVNTLLRYVGSKVPVGLNNSCEDSVHQECVAWEEEGERSDDFDREYDDDDEEEYKDLPEFEYSGCPPSKCLPIYEFESPYHPKHHFTFDNDITVKLDVFAERLIHSALEDAYLEYLTLLDTVCSHPPMNGVSENASMNSCSRLENGYLYHDENSWHNKSRSSLRRKCDANMECDLGKDVFWCATGGGGGVEHGLNNSGQVTASTELDLLNHKQNTSHVVENLIANGHTSVSHIFPYPSTSSSNLARSSYRISKRGRKMSATQRTYSTTAASEDIDGIIDHFMKFTYHPTGDDTASQQGSSFQSSTWGSSTASSLRYVRRFTSKKYTTKPLMLFIHGIGDSAEIWKSQQLFFRDRGYETVAMDLIGHGLSGCPRESKAYTFHSILTDVLVVFDRYSKERNVIVGHSYGCCFAAALARHRPKQVTHLILLSGGGPFPLCPQPSKLHLPHCLQACLQSLTSCNIKRKTFYVPSRRQTRLIRCFDIPSYVLKYITKGQVWLEGDVSFHKQIMIPTLLIYGLRDPFVTLVEECEMEKTIPRAFLELIPEASHMIMLEAPDQVNDMIYKFLRRWDR